MSVSNKGYGGPLPTKDFRRQVAMEVMLPFRDSISGEIAATTVRNLGVANFAGKVVQTILAVSTCGKDNTAPKVTADVRINGTSIFTTKPAIAHVSGEVAQHKTSYAEAADTGITAEVIDESANSFEIGDVLDWSAIYSGNANPTTKMANVSIIVEVEPNDP
jgi:hypothetical protein